MSLCHRPAALLPALLCLAAACGTAQAVAPKRRLEPANVASAESALQRGECGSASGQWRDLALASDDADVAERATAVGLACGQYSAAEAAAARWLQLAPGEDGPALARVRALLQAWRIDEAGAAFRAWLGAAGSPAGKRTLEAIGALAQDAGEEPTWAMLQGLELPAATTPAGASAVATSAPALAAGDVQLAIAGLALGAGDARAAIARARTARSAGAAAARVAAIVARAHAVLGEAAPALAAAGEALAGKGKEGDPLARADVLVLLDRTVDAESELQRLRSDPEVGPQAGRELARLAFMRADYAIAEERANSLLQEPQAQAMAVFILGAIAERRGDEREAIARYRLLEGSGMAAQAERRTALMLYRGGERDAALAVLAAQRGAEPEQRIRAELAIGSFLAEAGAANEGLARLNSESRRNPGHPDVDYQRAVLMEKAGQGDAAIALLEGMHKARPGDPAAANALGFTLADHKRELVRAEQLIRAAIAMQPDNAAILDSLGWVLFRRGQGAAALTPLQRAFRLLKDGEIGAHLAEVLAASGRKGEARDVLKVALAADPDNESLLATAARLAPGLSAPKPPPASLEPARRTST